ncbi:MAG: hypothetical protein K6G76_03270 [Lachnospiraceae bacterium]|nr:hypothetical protein [Lachnospiraceae bacterium]
MFLHLLNSEQKNLFMNLAIKAAEANGIVELEEKNMLKAYGIEMGIKPVYETDLKTTEIIACLNDICDEKTRKVIVFEIIGIMISDSVYDETEKEFVYNLAESFSVTTEQQDKMYELLIEYSNVFRRISNYILEI